MPAVRTANHPLRTRYSYWATRQIRSVPRMPSRARACRVHRPDAIHAYVPGLRAPPRSPQQRVPVSSRMLYPTNDHHVIRLSFFEPTCFPPIPASCRAPPTAPLARPARAPPPASVVASTYRDSAHCTPGAPHAQGRTRSRYFGCCGVLLVDFGRCVAPRSAPAARASAPGVSPPPH